MTLSSPLSLPLSSPLSSPFGSPLSLPLSSPFGSPLSLPLSAPLSLPLYVCPVCLGYSVDPENELILSGLMCEGYGIILSPNNRT